MRFGNGAKLMGLALLVLGLGGCGPGGEIDELLDDQAAPIQNPPAILNEIFASPRAPSGDANGDGVVNSTTDEFVEIVNVSGAPLGLGGWKLSDSVMTRFTFPAGTTLPPGAALVLFGGGDPARFGSFGGAQVFVSKGLGLNNAGDRVTLKNKARQLVDRVSYGSYGGRGRSLVREVDGDPAAPLVQHPVTPFSPGVQQDGAPFGVAPGLVKKVLVINFDPIIEAEGGRRLHEVLGWNDPHLLLDGYIADVQETSGGFVSYQIVEWVDADYLPVKLDGYQDTDQSYLDAWRAGGPFHQPDMADYGLIISDHDLAARVRAGEIDEVFAFGPPYGGFYESRMAGPGSYWCNAPGMPEIDSGRKFIIMGFSYERGVGEMLEDLGHRTESIMMHVYGSWNAVPQHNWDRFTLYDQIAPGQAACGNVHFAPNSTADYQWGNPTVVTSNCDDWLLNWPDLQGTTREVSAADWGGGDIRLHHRWWFGHLPRKDGVNPDGKQNNWWKYVVDFNSYP